ncbi:HPr family phosphocarrier protein [Treponema phagedenis]|uniref:HPr family phosphocarrier protein n=1 Tax=Treponema phagedenis TaxID=162 RepID=A0A0B7GU15_TREPH|nr:HPr family phosphocarrier protein [Treponema phagedenis]EFW38662.1 phosphocarrier, HPr family [Treponema phagedenis F0421]NVP23282.1 HPr family phosphocarrier protein [Treponema phagedenis]QEJ95370.1 HPr family phosphocarrier protein [Treponema phagedenis]QEJ97916.1 HPr family phosphocarrier protein [Treponema phagedenis]QEK01223.1 HPr family phosphocarrier protein [Treponema phagedenis]
MITKKLKVLNRAGIHARPAALIAQTANKFSSNLMFKKDNAEINAKSIMGIITMSAGYDTELILTAEGDDAAEAVAAIELLFTGKFEEE